MGERLIAPVLDFHASPKMSRVLINPYRLAASAFPLADLVAHWRLNEASGTRSDAHGSNHLTDVNTVTSAAGKLGDAASFASANSERLSIADNDALSVVHPTPFTLAAWANLATKGTSRSIAGKWTSSTTGYRIYFRNSFDRFVLRVNSTERAASTLGSPSTGTWYFVVGWLDPVAGTMNIQVNNGTVDTTSTAVAAADSTNDFLIGATHAGSSEFWDGLIDSVSLWKRVLTSDERTALYNGGAGLDYPA